MVVRAHRARCQPCTVTGQRARYLQTASGQVCNFVEPSDIMVIIEQSTAAVVCDICSAVDLTQSPPTIFCPVLMDLFPTWDRSFSKPVAKDYYLIHIDNLASRQSQQNGLRCEQEEKRKRTGLATFGQERAKPREN